eukprot:scaffold109_cov252-Pinguiococcus_pyrenoidosus.AAC.14
MSLAVRQGPGADGKLDPELSSSRHRPRQSDITASRTAGCFRASSARILQSAHRVSEEGPKQPDKLRQEVDAVALTVRQQHSWCHRRRHPSPRVGLHPDNEAKAPPRNPLGAQKPPEDFVNPRTQSPLPLEREDAHAVQRVQQVARKVCICSARHVPRL